MKHSGIVEDISVFILTYVHLGRLLRLQFRFPTSCVTLDELLNFSKPHSLLCETISDNSTSLGYCEK